MAFVHFAVCGLESHTKESPKSSSRGSARDLPHPRRCSRFSSASAAAQAVPGARAFCRVRGGQDARPPMEAHLPRHLPFRTHRPSVSSQTKRQQAASTPKRFARREAASAAVDLRRVCFRFGLQAACCRRRDQRAALACSDPRDGMYRRAPLRGRYPLFTFIRVYSWFALLSRKSRSGSPRFSYETTFLFLVASSTGASHRLF